MRNTTIADCNISLYPTTTDYPRLYLFYCIISFQAWKRSGGENITLIWRKNALKYRGFLTKTENCTIYYYRDK